MKAKVRTQRTLFVNKVGTSDGLICGSQGGIQEIPTHVDFHLQFCSYQNEAV